MKSRFGIDCGGIRNARTLRERCVIDQDSGCWRCAVATLWIRMPAGGYKTMRGRRAAATIAARAELPRDVYAFQAPHCAHEDCVRPDHAATGSRSDWMTALSGRGRLDTPARRATVAKYLLRTKVSIEQRTEVIQSSETARVLAARYGCSISLIHHIRSSAQAPAYRQRIRAPSVFEWRP